MQRNERRRKRVLDVSLRTSAFVITSMTAVKKSIAIELVSSLYLL